MYDERKMRKLGDTAEHAWMQEFLDRCFPESGDRVNADLNLSMAMCQAEPKSAQMGMQFLAQELRSRDEGAPDIDFLRFSLGVLFMSYVGVAISEGRCAPGEVPGELQFAISFNPEIIECANELGRFQFRDDQGE